MTGLSILALLAGLACIPVLDPDSRRWLRALMKARRERLAQLPPPRSEGYRPRASRAVRNPPPGNTAIPRKPGFAAGSGPPLHERMFPPPGSSGYRPTRKVNPATVRPPSSPSAVTPPSPLRAAELTAMVNAAKARGARGRLQPGVHYTDAPPRKETHSVEAFMMLRERLGQVSTRSVEVGATPRRPAPKPVSGTRRM